MPQPELLVRCGVAGAEQVQQVGVRQRRSMIEHAGGRVGVIGQSVHDGSFLLGRSGSVTGWRETRGMIARTSETIEPWRSRVRKVMRACGDDLLQGSS